MNFLQLVQELRREASVAGSGPTTIVGQTGMLEKLVNWTIDAWIDIQIDQPNWLFMNKQFTFNTVVSQRDYTAAGVGITDLKYWDTSSFLIYEQALGEADQAELVFLAYSKWRGAYRNQMNVRADQRPSIITQLPDRSIRFEARPDKIYTIDGDYKRSTQIFSDNLDVPTGIDEDLHRIIVWRALMYYADDQNAPDAMDKADNGYAPLSFRLMNEQLPKFDEDFEGLASAGSGTAFSALS